LHGLEQTNQKNHRGGTALGGTPPFEHPPSQTVQLNKRGATTRGGGGTKKKKTNKTANPNPQLVVIGAGVCFLESIFWGKGQGKKGTQRFELEAGGGGGGIENKNGWAGWCPPSTDEPKPHPTPPRKNKKREKNGGFFGTKWVGPQEKGGKG